MKYPIFLTPHVFPPEIPVLGFIRWYGLMYLVGISICFLFYKRAIKKGEFNIPIEDKGGLYDIIFFAILGILIGARLGFFVFYHPNSFIESPWEVIGINFADSMLSHYLIAVFFVLSLAMLLSPARKFVLSFYEKLNEKAKSTASMVGLISIAACAFFAALTAANEMPFLFVITLISIAVSSFMIAYYLKASSAVFYILVALLLLLVSAFAYNVSYSLSYGKFHYFGFSGMSYHGGFIGVLVALVIFSKRFNYKFFFITDKLAVPVPLALLCGRIGNFMNAELYGRVTDSIFGIRFPKYDSIPGGFMSFRKILKDQPLFLEKFYTEPRHPSQLYEGFLEGVVLFLILYFLSRYLMKNGKHLKNGIVTWAFIGGYGLFRFLVELVREPNEWAIGFKEGALQFIVGMKELEAFSGFKFTAGMAYSLPMFIIGIVAIIFLVVSSKKKA